MTLLPTAPPRCEKIYKNGRLKHTKLTFSDVDIEYWDKGFAVYHEGVLLHKMEWKKK